MDSPLLNGFKCFYVKHLGSADIKYSTQIHIISLLSSITYFSFYADLWHFCLDCTQVLIDTRLHFLWGKTLGTVTVIVKRAIFFPAAKSQHSVYTINAR